MGSSELSIETICFDVLGIIKALGYYKKCDLALKVFEWVRNRPDSDKLVNGSAVAVIISMLGERRIGGRLRWVSGDVCRDVNHVLPETSDVAWRWRLRLRWRWVEEEELFSLGWGGLGWAGGRILI
ncbi:Pentatricopeptide repeat-containing protein [Abeliophyllum distichum]|uniref:Pentatricopeptide repeat-containing protein n=1 Tax=Abeliophyllum distichum TaxID=126358 RepID=A0ABD1RB44_9LAMI